MRLLSTQAAATLRAIARDPAATPDHLLIFRDSATVAAKAIEAVAPGLEAAAHDAAKAEAARLRTLAEMAERQAPTVR